MGQFYVQDGIKRIAKHLEIHDNPSICRKVSSI